MSASINESSAHVKGFLQKPVFVFFALLSIVLVDRYFLLDRFSFNYLGSDDVIFWLGAQDYSQGIFREPYFYGQNYNFMLEALFAVPMLWCQVPLNIALPISTSLISLFPFVFFAAVLFRRKFYIAAYMFLVLPLSLSIDYALLNSMSRGFVSGLFFMGFLVYPLLDPKSPKNWFIAAISISLGYIFNPNCVIFAFPVALYLWMSNLKEWRFYLIFIVTALPFLYLEHIAKNFYELNPVYNTHPMSQLGFSFDLVIENFGKMDEFYTYFMPLIWKVGSLVLAVFLGSVVLLWKPNRLKAICIFCAIVLAIMTLGINKVNDSIHHLLLSSARMYMAMPLLIGLCLLWLIQERLHSNYSLPRYWMVLPLTIFFIKLSVLDQVLYFYTQKTNYGAVAIKKIKDIKCDCDNIKKLAQEKKAEFVVYSPTWTINTPEMMFYAYGCPLLTKDMPSGYLKFTERRSWVFEKERGSVHKTVLFYGLVQPKPEVQTAYGDNLEFTPGNPDYVLIKNNTLRNDTLFGRLHETYGR